MVAILIGAYWLVDAPSSVKPPTRSLDEVGATAPAAVDPVPPPPNQETPDRERDEPPAERETVEEPPTLDLRVAIRQWSAEYRLEASSRDALPETMRPHYTDNDLFLEFDRHGRATYRDYHLLSDDEKRRAYELVTTKIQVNWIETRFKEHQVHAGEALEFDVQSEALQARRRLDDPYWVLTHQSDGRYFLVHMKALYSAPTYRDLVQVTEDLRAGLPSVRMGVGLRPRFD